MKEFIPVYRRGKVLKNKLKIRPSYTEAADNLSQITNLFWEDLAVSEMILIK